MFYYDASDPELLKAEDQYMWGENILVAPVLEEGATERSLYLPQGEWYNLLTDEKRTGGCRIMKKLTSTTSPFSHVEVHSFLLAPEWITLPIIVPTS
jgi:alpha-glucosidase (family GH31 glycosyl hydrolase)